MILRIQNLTKKIIMMLMIVTSMTSYRWCWVMVSNGLRHIGDLRGQLRESALEGQKKGV